MHSLGARIPTLSRTFIRKVFIYSWNLSLLERNELEKKGVKRRWRAGETVESIGEAFHVSGRTTSWPWSKEHRTNLNFPTDQTSVAPPARCHRNPFIFLSGFWPANNYIQQGSVLRGACPFPPPLSPLSRERSAKSKLSDLIRYSWRGTDICSSSFSPDGLCKSRMKESKDLEREEREEWMYR